MGTIFSTLFSSRQVGTDEFGNRYFQAKRAHRYGRERRWVIYKGKSEASKVPPEWHAWLHHTTDEPLTEQAALAKRWQKPHQPNPTGSPGAYRPRGDQLSEGRHAPASGDYVPWTPDDAAESR